MGASFSVRERGGITLEELEADYRKRDTKLSLRLVREWLEASRPSSATPITSDSEVLLLSFHQK